MQLRMTIRQRKNKYKFLTMDEKKYFVFRGENESRNVEYKCTYLQNRVTSAENKLMVNKGEKRGVEG